MDFNQDTIDRLTVLREKKKFTDSDWEKRGLYPSDVDKVDEMVRLTDNCLDELLADIKVNRTEKQVRNTLIKGLKRFKNSHYDTEEREFIGEEFYKIGSILGIDISESLNDWLYGRVIGTLIGLTKKQEVIVNTRSFECTKCKLALNMGITSTREGVPNFWIIGQCNQCGEHNLLSTGENIGGLKFENFTSTEFLDSNKNSEEQVKARLEQIKHFRK